MKALFIVAAVLLVLAFLLFCRVHLYVEYAQEEFQFRARYLFIRYRMKPGGQGKAKPKPKKKGPAKVSFEQIRQFIDLFERFRADVSRAAAGIRRHTRIDRLDLSLVVAQDGPAEAAVAFGGVCAVLYPALAGLNALLPIRRRFVQIEPQVGGECGVEFRCAVSARLGALLAVGLSTGARVVVSLLRAPQRPPARPKPKPAR